MCAYHFCVGDLLDSLDPFLFVKSIAAQLATQMSSYRAMLEAIDWEHETLDADPGAYCAALSQTHSGRRFSTRQRSLSWTLSTNHSVTLGAILRV